MTTAPVASISTTPNHPTAWNRAIVAHARLVRVESNLQSFVLLVIRLFFGWELFVSGRSHLQNVPAMVKNFTDWGVPLPHLNVYISGCTELVGGLLILVGLASRLISIPLVINFIVAYLTASRETVKALVFGPSRLDAIDKFTSDSAFFFLIAALVILAFGPGKASLDAIIRRMVFGRQVTVPQLPLAPASRW